ncbi:hypothetical protein WJX81_001056 [Elliptochloris bilobata]|uniref:Histidine phosphatase family protein n=1 Tax=Elliptochloris bilobata TaxID=381761 RepID=A0AAW1RBD3_9CHLO
MQDSLQIVTAPAPRHAERQALVDVTTAGAGSLTDGRMLVAEKQVVIVRHGLTTWNEQRRIQGASDESVLTAFGERQAVRCRDALSRVPFDSCFSSPIRRAARFADIMWEGRDAPLVRTDSLKEAYLGWLQGMRQEDAAAQHETTFRQWRENPAAFGIGDRYPVDEVFAEAKNAWQQVLDAPGSIHLIVTHKSILRALLCVALGLPPTAFRAVDVHNGGICNFRVNRRGEPMLVNLNLTSHMHTDGVFY